MDCGNLRAVDASGVPVRGFTPMHPFPGMALGGPKWARYAFIVLLLVAVGACIIGPFASW